MSVKIMLADDHGIMRTGLRSLLEKEEDMEVIAEAQDGRNALKLAQKIKPDVIIMDIGMPDLNGIEATRQILAVLPRIKIIALSMHSDRRFVARMLNRGVPAAVVQSFTGHSLRQLQGYSHVDMETKRAALAL